MIGGARWSKVSQSLFSDQQMFRIPSPKEGKPLPVGVTIIRALKQKVNEFLESNPGKLTIMLETNVVGIVVGIFNGNMCSVLDLERLRYWSSIQSCQWVD